MKYKIEIYVGEAEAPEYVDDSDTPFQTLTAGDLINPTWNSDEHAGYYPADRLRVMRVEHRLWKGYSQLMVYCEEVLASHRSPA